ncbi:hypothetical protein CMI37_15695 [Candidatus Pacearchaeota archaeon]|nr:hypothetical protein [Candidatus Pacearchaeota archaeon]
MDLNHEYKLESGCTLKLTFIGSTEADDFYKASEGEAETNGFALAGVLLKHGCIKNYPGFQKGFMKYIQEKAKVSLEATANIVELKL